MTGGAPMKAVLLLLAGVGLALSGCAAGPNYHTPKPDTPPAFVPRTAAHRAGTAAADAARATTPAPDLATWWHALNDPELDSLVERAIQSNPDLEIALTRRQQERTT